MITVDEILDELEGKSKDELIVIAKNQYDEFMEKTLAFCEKNNIDSKPDEFNTNISYLIQLICGVDGRVDKEEYEAYTKLCEAMKIEVLSLDKVRENVRNITAEDKNFGLGIATILVKFGVLSLGDESKAKELVLKYVGSILSYNGVIDSKEIEFLTQISEINVDDGNDSGDSNVSTVDDSYEDNSLADTNRGESVKIIEHNATLNSTDYGYYLSVGADLLNPNASLVAHDVTVKIVVKDSSGRILASDSTNIDYIDSNSHFYYGTEINIDSGSPASYNIQVETDEFVNGPENSDFATGITTSHFNRERSRWGDGVRITGNVENLYNKKLWVELYFVFYNAAGQITGGYGPVSQDLYGRSEDGFDFTLNCNVDASSVKTSATFDFFELVN